MGGHIDANSGCHCQQNSPPPKQLGGKTQICVSVYTRKYKRRHGWMLRNPFVNLVGIFLQRVLFTQPFLGCLRRKHNLSFQYRVSPWTGRISNFSNIIKKIVGNFAKTMKINIYRNKHDLISIDNNQTKSKASSITKTKILNTPK